MNSRLLSWLVFLVALAFGSAAKAQDIRQLTWGLSKEAVKEKEGKQDYREGITPEGFRYLYFAGSVGGQEALLSFFFVSDKLFSVKYVFTDIQKENGKYIDRFYEVEVLLDKKYGETEIQKTFSDEAIRMEPDKWGDGVANGNLTMFTNRDNTRSEIEHKLTLSKGTIAHTVDYRSKALLKAVASSVKDPSADF